MAYFTETETSVHAVLPHLHTSSPEHIHSKETLTDTPVKGTPRCQKLFDSKSLFSFPKAGVFWISACWLGSRKPGRLTENSYIFPKHSLRQNSNKKRVFAIFSSREILRLEAHWFTDFFRSRPLALFTSQTRWQVCAHTSRHKLLNWKLLVAKLLF